MSEPFIPASWFVGTGPTVERFVPEHSFTNGAEAHQHEGRAGQTIKHIPAIHLPGDQTRAEITRQWDPIRKRWIRGFDCGRVFFSAEQWEVMRLVEEGHNVFVTGCGGCGKSAALNAIEEHMTLLGKSMWTTASTGIAAIAVGGFTIHSFLGTGIADQIADLPDDPDWSGLNRALNDADIIKVDEISMLTGDYIDMIDYAFREALFSDKPFGGKQMIFSGDFLQLSPVVLSKDPKKISRKFPFQAKAWEAGDVRTVELTETFRTSDMELFRHLSAVRLNEATEETYNFFNQRVRKDLKDPTTLFPKNSEASHYNRAMLARHPGEERTYKASIMATKPWDREGIIRDCIAEEYLDLKIDAPVIILINDKETRVVNGDRGTVTEMGDDYLVVHVPRINNDVLVQRNMWTKTRRDRKGEPQIVASLTQFPVKLAWALTIHKSQGMSLDRVDINIDNVFATHQTYVALSRARSFEGISISIPLRPHHIRVEDECKQFYLNLRG
jgi:ATP-dependent DNA helicase PIF1